MKIVIFGLTISSSWGNGHATLWRGLCRALIRQGHDVVFIERDVPYYATHRDLHELAGGALKFYQDFESILPEASMHLSEADAAIVTSYCPDGIQASEIVLGSRARLKIFYDLDTPVTLRAIKEGKTLNYILPEGLGAFDLVLSYTGGAALDELKHNLHARQVAPLYGSVDPEVHRPASAREHYRADLSYLGTYAADRQAALNELFVEPARRLPGQRFVIGGAQYPEDFPWTDNIFFVQHLPPSEHPAFFCSSRMTLNVTRQAMAEMGYCPSGRLFEAAACGVPILSDWWEGLDEFFEPGKEILIATSAAEAIDALGLPESNLRGIAEAARARTLREHTAEKRARELIFQIEEALRSGQETSQTLVEA